MKKSRYLLLMIATFLVTTSQAQPGVYYETVEPGTFFICAWDNVRVHEYPNQGSPNVGTIAYTEEVRHLGREAFVRSENRNYVFVETKDGTQGWISQGFVVAGGGSVVILSDAPIFQKPNTTTTITNQQFSAGEVLILSEFKDGWVRLTGKQKIKDGWVQGYDKLSAESYDIEAASLLATALSLPKQEDRLRELRELRGGRSYLSPEMLMIIDQTIASAYGPAPSTPRPTSQPEFDGNVYYDDPGPYFATGEDAFSRPNAGSNSNLTPTYPAATQTMTYAPPAAAAAATQAANQAAAAAQQAATMRPQPVSTLPYNYQEREVVDMNTGVSYFRIKETGTIQPVKAKSPKSEYYAYHKTLPIGSKVMLAVPGTTMFVELEIIARLRPDNPNMIGLGAEVIKAVYGEIAAKDVGSASIEYPKP